MDSDVEKIKEKLSIVDVVGGYVQLQRAGANFRARCPFHKEKTPSFMVSPERGTYMCFGCGERGDIFSFVQKMDGVDFPTALRQLAERAGVTLSRRSFTQASPERKEKEERLKEACEAAAQFYTDELLKHKDVLKYIEERGVKEDTRASWRIGYAPAQWSALSDYLTQQKGFSMQELVDAGLAVRSQNSDDRVYDRFRGRIMFPISDLSGHVIAFSGRFFEKMKDSKEEGEPAKYVNSPETDLFKKSKILYGLDKAKNFIRKADCILLVEGQFDVVLSHQAGLRWATAVSGTALTEEHVNLLSRFSKQLVLALDADQAGLNAGLKSTSLAFKHGFDVRIPTFSAKDPADLVKEDPELLREAIRNSKTAVEFFLDAFYKNIKNELAYKHLVETHIFPLVASLQSKVDQQHFIQIISRRIGASEDDIREQIRMSPPQSSDLSFKDEEAKVGQEITPYSQTLAMLQFYFDKNREVQDALIEIVGDSIYQESIKRYVDEAEQFRFRFESLGSEIERVRDDLMRTLQRSHILESIDDINKKLRMSGANDPALLQKLVTLKKKEQELRN